jgi:hypothetical protein
MTTMTTDMETTDTPALPAVQKFTLSPDDKNLIPTFDPKVKFVVTSKDEFEQAAERVKGLKKLLKKVSDHYSTITRAIDVVKGIVLDMKRKDTQPIEHAITVVDGAAIAWKLKVEREEAEIKRKAEAEAQRKAEAEKVAAAAALKQAAAATKDAEIKKALKAEAAATLAMPAIPERVNITSSIPKVSGYANRTTYSAECLSLAEVVKGICDGKIPLNAVMFNQTVGNQAATQQKEALNWPGVRVVKKTGSATR